MLGLDDGLRSAPTNEKAITHWQLLLNILESRRCADLINACRRIRRYSKRKPLWGDSEAAVAEPRPTEVQGWNRFPIGDETRSPEAEQGSQA
jgi:hypothetical protein